MGNNITFIITCLTEEWKDNDGQKYGPTIIKWILTTVLEKVSGKHGWDNKKIKELLVNRQPQTLGMKILEIEETNIHVA